ncbi:transmembrane protein 69-like isoform X2 [Phycodurus eques]|uniref:transmembrane protein 69-like isoform X2 n=1 Tax=Phycodurus eques TaxID=693459 RepID=UPI002ACD7661|nr:transmembrane protein 69-like isoform X2 [Phycodurus eques]
MLSVVFKRKSTVAAQKLLHLARHPPKCWPSSLLRVTNCGSDPQLVSWASLARPSTEWPQVSWEKLKKRLQPEPPPRELDLLRYDMKDLWKSPKPALWLGFAGLIPFVAPPLFMGVTESYLPEFAYAQVAYAASIVSFLGGARWGFALPDSSPAKPDWINLSNSVIPSLLAWVTMLMADSIVPAATMVIMALGISLHYDLSLLPTYPSWFKALRAILTMVAFFSLVGTLIAHGIYPEKNLFSE